MTTCLSLLLLTDFLRKENEMALQRAEMRMVRLGLDDIIAVLQQNRLQWYVHVLQKEDSD